MPRVNYANIGRFDDALTLTEHVLDDYERILGTDHPDTIKTRAWFEQLRSRPPDEP